jgi:hypothetical protein
MRRHGETAVGSDAQAFFFDPAQTARERIASRPGAQHGKALCENVVRA